MIEIDLAAICRCYEEKFVPSFAEKLEYAPGECEFVILPASDADLAAQAETSNEVFDALRKAALDDKVRVQTMVTLRASDIYWTLRRFVRPPECFQEYWVSPEGDMPDPMLKLPKELVRELMVKVNAKIRESGRFTEEPRNQAEARRLDGAEEAAAK